MASRPWLDDLSDDWIPEQIVSPHPPNALDGPSAQPRSRIPIARNSPAPLAPLVGAPLAKRRASAGRSRSALAERSLSDNNICSTSADLEIDPKQDDGRRRSSRSFSAASINSMIHHGDDAAAFDSVQRSPTKKPQIHGTPEWRKRLLKGQMAYSDQKDLFSPMGLEKLFNKPSPALPKPSSKARLLQKFGDMPSSPPPWKPASQPNTLEDDLLEDWDEEAGKDDSVMADDTNQSSDKNERSGAENESNSGTQNATAIHRPTHQSLLELGEKTEQDGKSRAVSGQTEMENESFSPVYITKNNGVDGQVAYTPMNITKSQMASRFEALQRKDSKTDESSELDFTKEKGGDSSLFAKLRDDTLPDDLPVGTPDVVEINKYITTRRGGYSNDGSFHTKPLSPSSTSSLKSRPRDRTLDTTSNTVALKDQDTAKSSSEITISNHASAVPEGTTTPRQAKSTLSHRSSGSPLKLFGNHDTFTANRLHRRLTQLEDQTEPTENLPFEDETDSYHITTGKENHTSVKESTYSKTVIQNSNSARIVDRRDFSKASSFGQGEFDAYKFPDEFTSQSDEHELIENDSVNDLEQSPPSHAVPPGSRPQFRFHLDESPTLHHPPSGKRKMSKASSRNSLGSAWSTNDLKHAKVRSRQGTLESIPQHSETLEPAEGKRAPTSPGKNPTPKRRRTLHAVDLEETNDLADESLMERNQTVQGVAGRKRKNARQGIQNNMADPETLAKRHILRPRNPTPSQRRRDLIQAEVLEAAEAFVQSSPRLHVIQEHLDSSNLEGNSPGPDEARAVATEVAAFSMRLAKAAKGEIRKRSVTTQDFLDEAMKIMEFIRTKGRPASGLESLEESESESLLELPTNLEAPENPGTFSRPPSRDDRPNSGWRNPNNAQDVDTQVLNHLRRFQERSDDFFGSSVRSLHVSQAQQSSPNSRDMFAGHTNQIRVHDGRRARNTRDAMSVAILNADPDSFEGTDGTYQSNPSTQSSFGKTALSNGSRRSDNVATLAPEAVAHLIPHEIAGMSFDREKGIWVRKRKMDKANKNVGDISGTNASEDDPFLDIPDLSVDESKEVHYKSSEAKEFLTDEIQCQKTALSDTVRDDLHEQVGEVTQVLEPPLSSVVSKPTFMMSSAGQPETRATSWSEDNSMASQKHPTHQQSRVQHETFSDDVEHEITIDEGRNGSPRRRKEHRLRDITLSFSTPPAPYRWGNDRDMNDESIMSQSVDGLNDVSEYHAEPPTLRHEVRSSTKSFSRQSSKRTTFTRQHLNFEAVPPIDELNELSIVADDRIGRRVKLSVSIGNKMATTVSNRQAMAPVPSSPNKGDVTFMLSDLPDFSINQIDERENPNRVLVKRDGSIAVEDRYGIGSAELVKALQDEEPDEPYWEDLRRVSLCSKGLPNLHRLEVFCWRLEEVDVSNNALHQVIGLPPTVRRLKASDNCLSSLTTWDHLPNLQYLDISHNDVDALIGLGNLVHLRELNASDNRIEDIDDILFLDGLMKLNLGRNKLNRIDLQKSNL